MQFVIFFPIVFRQVTKKLHRGEADSTMRFVWQDSFIASVLISKVIIHESVDLKESYAANCTVWNSLNSSFNLHNLKHTQCNEIIMPTDFTNANFIWINNYCKHSFSRYSPQLGQF